MKTVRYSQPSAVIRRVYTRLPRHDFVDRASCVTNFGVMSTKLRQSCCNFAFMKLLVKIFDAMMRVPPVVLSAVAIGGMAFG